RAAAWSSRARNTGEGRPLYCAAPSTAIASEERASSWAPASATATTTAAQPKVSAIIRVTVATTLRRRVQKGMEERQQGKGVEGRGTARYGIYQGLVKSSSKSARARGSPDWPSQNSALRRTPGSGCVRAIRMRAVTAASRGGTTQRPPT